NKTDLNTNISLSKLIEHKEINPTSEGFKKEFLIVCNTIKKLFDKVTTRHHSNMIHITLEQILIPGKPGEDSTESISATPEQSEKNKTDTAESSQNQLDSKQVLQENEDSSIELIEKIIKTAYTQAINAKDQGLSDSPEADGSCTEETDCVLDDLFEISISENQTTAFIKKTKKFDGNSQLPVLPDIQDMLRQKQISYGILDDEAIKTWMSKSSVEKIVIASGLEPVHGHDGEIKYHFETNFTNPGKISDDGSIDFRERGDIPYVRKTDLLAQKTPSKEGKPGISVSGINIPVNEVNDPVFVPGPGTELSEDGLAIHAAIDGQPHLDALGTVSVNPELVIPGDIDFETGNIDFKGNIVVKGMIKEGFTVKGINLTAKEIEGGTIDLSGDLNISAGITDSTISAQGNIYAKFINHSTIMGFGNLCVSKEIIDSNIIISGSCQNQTGHIISSNITAKLGIEAGKIGTTASKPAKLMVGMDEHIEMLKKQVEESLEKSMNKSTSLKDDIIKLEDKDQELYRQISEKAHIQDRAQIEIKELEKSIPELEKSNDRVKLQQISKDIQKLIDRAKDAEKELNTIFETQDSIANEIERLKNQINLSEETNKKLVLERKALKDFSKKNTPIAIVSIAKTITQDSIVRGPHASIILKEDTSRCKIQELASQDEGIKFHEMTISDI
ncbi:MAG: DUF342 domain-containing protein, partial [Proteobacteria bacterium]|nr:DUF342 domain-containing protein [Pseudomonadota bacterium]MBU1584233.1 DUF342 domain-containing protein [Pseudomonadota bacterium]